MNNMIKKSNYSFCQSELHLNLLFHFEGIPHMNEYFIIYDHKIPTFNRHFSHFLVLEPEINIY